MFHESPDFKMGIVLIDDTLGTVQRIMTLQAHKYD